ncbi:MAG TPA: serine hydrolase domain-containing protein [Nocardioides sp.]|uniref:serine hydrolase domain-containing protein n=1 Tax=Nocardioides sp. TaxID=35761 RepID=UPI002D7E9444|nr:serine hydrolase domain-containing protein [Nocardioides sp.]HET6652703.1 serine hydrolase domain-containing protein [Nocardioides sp.]
MDAQGSVAPGFEPVRELFADLVTPSPGTGSAFAAWHEGRWVVDLWGGYADAARTRPWRDDTLVMPYSVTKPFAAVCVALLADRGLVDLDAPMAAYWPALPGGATVRQVLTHTSGHVVLDEPQPVEAFYDWDLMCAALERQQPAWPPGTALGESALFYGHLLGQVVRAVDGRSLGGFLHDEVCAPLGLDFHVGVPEPDLDRVADVTGFGDEFDRGKRERGGLMLEALSNPPGALDPDVVNGAAWRRAEVPAVNGHGTARAVAGLFAALGEGRLLSPAMLTEVTSVQADGHDRVVNETCQWGLGVAIEPADGWGMGGVGGSFGWWSHAGQYAVAFLSGCVVSDRDRGGELENSVRAVLGMSPV